jgi:hypothetical protein
MGGADPLDRFSARGPVDRVRLVVYAVLFVLALAALALRARWIDASTAASAKAYIVLRGETDEQQPISVELERRRRIHSLNVQLSGLCENGGRYMVGWSPDTPRIPFRASPQGLVAREYGKRVSSGGIVSRTVVWTTAHLAPRAAAADGDLRYQTTFRYPDGHRLRCDSGYVHWSASRGRGPSASGQDRLSYAPVASLAISPSRARLAFAAAVDHVCAVTYNEQRVPERRPRSGRDAAILRLLERVLRHQHEYDEIARLGAPPEASGLYRAWRLNMRERIGLEWLAARRARANVRGGRAALFEVQFLKIEGDSLGQEFGLRICTSNGPLRPRPRPPVRADTQLVQA